MLEVSRNNWRLKIKVNIFLLQYDGFSDDNSHLSTLRRFSQRFFYFLEVFDELYLATKTMSTRIDIEQLIAENGTTRTTNSASYR